MGSTTAAGTTLAISAASPATYDATGFAALTFIEIGGIDKIGSFGPQFAKVEFQPLKGPKDKHKGSCDFGALQPSMAFDDADAGQTLLRTSADDETSKLYSLLVVYPTGAKRYFQGRTFGAPESADSADSIVMQNPVVEICKKVIKVAAPTS